MIHRCLAFFLVCLFSVSPIYPLSWTSSVNLSGPTANIGSDNADVGMDSAGNAVAVWAEVLMGVSQIRASTLLAGETTWSPAVTISDPMAAATVPRVAVDPAGNAVAVWLATPGVEAAVYTFATGMWSAVLTISADVFDDAPQIGVDSFGNATAVWKSTIAGIIQTSRLPFGSLVWSAPVTISSPSTASAPQVAVSSGGNAVAVWEETVLGDLVIRASAYSFVMDTWLAAATISGIPGPSISPDVAIDSSNNAVAVWQELFMGDQVIRSATFSFVTELWSAPQSISNPGASQPQIAMSGSGNAVAVWSEAVGLDFQVQSASLPFGGAWTAQVPISGLSGALPSPDVAVDDSGNATAVWSETSTTIFAATLTFGGSWTDAIPISAVGVSAAFPHVAMNDDGNATAIWLFDDGMSNFVQAASGTTSIPPSNVQGRQTRDRFIRQEDLINVLTWTSPDPSIVSYRIYRGTNTNLIGETSATRFEDHRRPPHQITLYFITSINTDGIESPPISITVFPR